MNCRDVRDIADSFLCDELLTETNHDILRHLETCASCRAEIDVRRRLRDGLRGAFNRAPELAPSPEFQIRLRDRLREAAARRARSSSSSWRWLALAAAGIVLVAGVAAIIVTTRSAESARLLAQDAIGDHENCALKFRLERRPVSLEQAAREFDGAYSVLLTAPPNEVSTRDGSVRVIERHSCAYDGRRFGHVVMQFSGHVVSLLMTANDAGAGRPGSDASPHVIGGHVDGLSVVRVNGTHHAILLVSDLDSGALEQLSTAIAVPLARRLEVSLTPGRGRVASAEFDRASELVAVGSLATAERPERVRRPRVQCRGSVVN